MTRILVPVDGSEKDGRALAVAADIAKLAGADVVVLVVEASANKRLADVGPLAVLAEAHPRRDELEADAARIAADLRARIDGNVTSSVVESGDVPGAILAAADEHNALLIVMATQAPRAVGRMVHGSVVDKVIRESSRPVVVVPPRAADLSGKTVRFRRVLVPLDGSQASQRVIDTLASLPGAQELELILLHVARRERTGGHPLPPMDPLTAEGQAPEWIHVQATQAQSRLDEIAKRLRGAGIKATTRVVESGDAAGSIVEAIRGEPADAIAMGTRGAGGVRRMTHGSVATAVVRNSEVPVMLIR
jgi:nucleotide-binding universal stress UspA family protein